MTTVHKKAITKSLQEQGGLAAPNDVLRSLLGPLVQEALQQEFTRFIGVDNHVRSSERKGIRNGSYNRTLKTRIGSIELRVPRDRAGVFRPSLFEKYERSEQALVLAMAEMYFQGVSTRDVTRVIETLCGHSISASDISLLTRKLDVHLSAWRSRALTSSTYPYLLIDAHYERVRREGQVRSTASLWVIGVTPQGIREHLGAWTGNSESTDTWSTVFADLIKRGLTGVEYAVSDEHLGLRSALHKYFPHAPLQRCQVHYLRNAYGKVSSDRAHKIMSEGLKDAFNASTKDEAIIRIKKLIEELKPLSENAANWLADTYEETLVCFTFDDQKVRNKLRSTNSVERNNLEMRRRTKVIGIFPHEASLLRLLTALAVERSEEWSAIPWLRLPNSTPLTITPHLRRQRQLKSEYLKKIAA